MKKLFLATFAVACFSQATAQDVFITLRDSVKIKTEIILIKDQYLRTQAGTVGLNEIFSIRFVDENEFNKNPEVSRELLTKNINVYVGSVKMERVIVPVEEKPAEVITRTPVIYREANKKMTAAIGLGAGIDYGGLGARFTYLVDRHVGLFGGAGYTTAGVGLNGGVIGRINTEKKFTPTFAVMYGYNGIYQSPMRRRSRRPTDQFYYGPSIALGVESKLGPKRKNYLHFQVVIPFRSTSTSLQNLFSLGYNFVIQ